jgi:hypothetical protein
VTEKVPPWKAWPHSLWNEYVPLSLLALPVALALIAQFEVAVPLNATWFEPTEPFTIGPCAKLCESQKTLKPPTRGTSLVPFC